MEFVIRSRRGGKTYAAVQAYGQNPKAVIIVPNQQMAARLREDYPNLQCQVVAWTQRESLRGLEPGPVCVENLDMILSMELRGTELTATATGVIR